MSSGVLQKICVSCGKNVANLPRVKDDEGQYYCHPCWNRAIAQPVQQPSEELLQENDSVEDEDPFAALGAAVETAPADALEALGAAASSKRSAPELMRCPDCGGWYDYTGMSRNGVCKRCNSQQLSPAGGRAEGIHQVMLPRGQGAKTAINWPLRFGIALICGILALVLYVAQHGTDKMHDSAPSPETAAQNGTDKNNDSPASPETVAEMQAAARQRAAADAIADAAAAKQKAIDDANARQQAADAAAREQVAQDAQKQQAALDEAARQQAAANEVARRQAAYSAEGDKIIAALNNYLNDLQANDVASAKCQQLWNALRMDEGNRQNQIAINALKNADADLAELQQYPRDHVIALIRGNLDKPDSNLSDVSKARLRALLGEK